MNERKWIDIEPRNSSLSACGNEKKTEQFNSGELRIIFRSISTGTLLDG